MHNAYELRDSILSNLIINQNTACIYVYLLFFRHQRTTALTTTYITYVCSHSLVIMLQFKFSTVLLCLYVCLYYDISVDTDVCSMIDLRTVSW